MSNVRKELEETNSLEIYSDIISKLKSSDIFYLEELNGKLFITNGKMGVELDKKMCNRLSSYFMNIADVVE